MVLCALTAGIISCEKPIVGEGPVVSETRAMSAITGITLQMNGNVYFKQDTATKLEVSAHQNILNELVTFVSNGKLVIKYRNGKTYDADPNIRITVSGPGVSGFELNTSGSIYVTNAIQVPALYLRVAGATGGTVTNEKFRTSGSGKIDMSAVSAATVNAHNSGSGDIKIKVSNHLDATIEGSGSIYFIGYPSISSHISGSGELLHF